MRYFLTAVRVLHGEVEGRFVDALGVHAPGLGRVGKGLLKLDKLGEVGVVERVDLAQVAARVELVEPDLARGRAFLEEEHHGLHARALERAAGAVEHGVKVAVFQQQLAQAHRGVVGVGEEGVLNDDAAAPASFQHPDEVLEEEEGGLPGAYWEVLLHFLALLAAEGRVCQHHVVAVLVLNVGEVFAERIGVDDVGRFDAMQDHVHDRDDVGEGLLLLAIEGAGLERGEVLGGKVAFRFQVIERFAEEAGRAAGPVIDPFADARLRDLYDGTNERARCVVFAAVAPRVAHTFDLFIIESR